MKLIIFQGEITTISTASFWSDLVKQFVFWWIQHARAAAARGNGHACQQEGRKHRAKMTACVLHPAKQLMAATDEQNVIKRPGHIW